MLFLGVLSVIQMITLPGLLLIRLFPGQRTPMQRAVYIFMLSLLANHTAVLLLVALGIYLRSVVLILFTLQAILFVWLYREQLFATWGNLEETIKKSATQAARSLNNGLQKNFWSTALYALFGLLAVTALGWVLWVWVVNFDTVFQTWDAWASWDRWAEKWADNRIPGDTWEYPQMIPVLYSIGYKFIGTVAVKFFGKSIMPLFLLAIGLMFFDLGRRQRSYAFMLSAALVVYMFAVLFNKYIADGYVDIPVACFSLMAIYSLLVAQDAKGDNELHTTLLLGSLATATAAITKQTGLYIVALYPVLAFLWILRQRKGFGWPKIAKLAGWHVLIVLLFVLPWYAFMQYRIVYGGNVSNIQYVINDIYGDMSMTGRFLAAVSLLQQFIHLYAFAILSFFVLKPPMRHLLLMLILPFSILWAFFLGYEVRNLAVALPPLALVTGAAFEGWVERIVAYQKDVKAFQSSAFRIFLALGFLLGIMTWQVTSERLIDHQIRLQKQIYEAQLNASLYSYFNSAGGPQQMLTNYPTSWLPGLEGTWVNQLFADYDAYQASLRNNPNVTLLLIRLPSAELQIQKEIQAMLDAGVYELLLTEAQYSLIYIPPR